MSHSGDVVVKEARKVLIFTTIRFLSSMLTSVGSLNRIIVDA